MNTVSKLALTKALEDFQEDSDFKKAISEIDKILLFPNEYPVYRYDLSIYANGFKSELFLIHTKEVGTLAIEQMLNENPDLSPAQCLLKHGFKLANESLRSDHYSENMKIFLVRNKEGML